MCVNSIKTDTTFEMSAKFISIHCTKCIMILQMGEATDGTEELHLRSMLFFKMSNNICCLVNT
jgi:hypothetical protein